MLDVSATCHMPDVLEAPYRPALRDECAGGQAVRLAGRVVLPVMLSALMVLMRCRRLATGWRFSIRRITQWSKQRRLTACPAGTCHLEQRHGCFAHGARV